MNAVRQLITFACLLSVPSVVLADGGRLQHSSIVTSGEESWQVSVFTAPTPVRQGMVDVSILVQNADSGELIPDARVELRLVHDQAEMPGVPANPSLGRGYYEARLALLHSGTWTVDVLVGEAMPLVTFPLEVLPPPPPWQQHLIWILLPVVPIGLFVLRELALHAQPSRESATITQEEGMRS